MDDRDLITKVLDIHERHATALTETKHTMNAIQKDIDRLTDLVQSTSAATVEAVDEVRTHIEEHTKKTSERNEILKNHFWLIQGIQAAFYAALGLVQYFRGK